jgi:hypothetical protein
MFTPSAASDRPNSSQDRSHAALGQNAGATDQLRGQRILDQSMKAMRIEMIVVQTGNLVVQTRPHFPGEEVMAQCLRGPHFRC